MSGSPEEIDAVVVGAGFARLYMLYRLRALGVSVRIFEAGGDIGGTWYWNRYPGARCDVESMDYSYSFSEALQQEWHWSERYASQPEILRYINHVADRFALRRDITLSTRVTEAVFDEAAARWTILTDRGDMLSPRFCIMATGCLSVPQTPNIIEGLETFKGRWFQTSRWPQACIDFRGQRVGIIGTGSSAIQSIPIIARQAAHLCVFQRTPNFSVPAHNSALDPAYEQRVKADYVGFRRKARESRIGIAIERNEESALEASPERRAQEYQARWQRGGIGITGAFPDLLINEEANRTLAVFVEDKIRAIVRDPDTARALVQWDYPIGTKRVCVDTDYYDTFNRDNVTLVDLRRDPIAAITPDGLRTRSAEHKLDAIVFAIGFDAMTGALLGMDIRGRRGETLKDKWAEGPRSFLGLSVAGFPNLFIITGPGSPSVLTNMIVSIEQQVDWIADCIVDLRRLDGISIEATPEAEKAWVDHANAVADATLFRKASSWYVGANIPGKPRVVLPYLGGFPAYRQKCDAVAAGSYAGFVSSKQPGAWT
jgi:cyclohexanone monooxygenase